VKRFGLLVFAVGIAAAAPAAIAMPVRDAEPRPTTAVARQTASAEPTGVHITPLSHAMLASSVHADGEGIKIATKGPRDMLVTSITVDPGGSFGWHRHPGPVLVSVNQGTLSLYMPARHGCPREDVTAGQAFIEGGGDVDLARNETSTPVELNATFLARTGTQDFPTPEQRPAGCHV